MTLVFGNKVFFNGVKNIDSLGSITSCCSGNEPALEEQKPNSREWQKLSLYIDSFDNK